MDFRNVLLKLICIPVVNRIEQNLDFLMLNLLEKPARKVRLMILRSYMISTQILPKFRYGRFRR